MPRSPYHIARAAPVGRLTVTAVCLAASLLMAGCRQDMHDQPRYEPLEASEFFANRMASRPPVEGTVARGQLRDDEGFYTGMVAGEFVLELPMPLNADLLARGRSRFDVFCSPCHGRLGDGKGMIVQRGFKQPTSFHDPRLRAAAPGYFFDVMSNGFGDMSSYRSQISSADRWAITAYLRALQFSRNVPVDLLSDKQRGRLAQGNLAQGQAEAPGVDGQETH